jgi:hypothetical protein
MLKDSKGNIFTAAKVLVRTAEVDHKARASTTNYLLTDGRALKYDLESDAFEIVETGDKLLRILR